MEGYDDFLTMTVGTLKDFVSLRGLCTSGRKIELVARAFAAFELKLPVKLSQEEHDAKLHAEYQGRLQKYGLDDPKSTKTWIDDVSKWPTVDLGKVFAYILTNKEFHSEYIGKYKDQKAFSYWMSNFVGAVMYSDNNGKCILKCNVTPSQHIRDEPREVWVALKRDGTILCGWCTCIAGTSATCNHMIALLYKLEYASNIGYNDPACTSIPCGWNVSTRKDVQPGKVMDMIIRKDKKTNDRNIPTGIISQSWKVFDPRKEGQQVVTDKQKDKFLVEYRKIRPTAQLFCSVESGNLSQEVWPLMITDRADKYMQSLNGSESNQHVISGFMEILPLKENEVKKIEKATRQQGKSPSWMAQRKGRITSSKFKDVSTKIDSISKSRGPVRPKTTQMVANLVFGSPSIGHLPAIKWGKDKEDQAFREFHILALSQHENCKMTKSGLWVLKDKPYIGASPDGVMTCGCCSSACIEIKCPFGIREHAVQEKWNETDFLECVDGKIQLKKNHKYYYQVTGQMATTGMSKSFFIVWTTKGMHVDLIQYDLAFWTQVLQNLDLFFKSYMVKVLLNMQSIFFCSLCDKVIFECEELKPDSNENSICCDMCGAWFHFNCVNVTNIGETEEWFCQDCLTFH